MNASELTTSSESAFSRIRERCASHIRRGCAAALAVVLFCEPVGGINITMQLQQEGMNPDSDPTGQLLQFIANAAAAFWEDVLPQPGNYEVDIWWDTEELTGQMLGQWSFEAAPADNNIRINADPRDTDDNPVPWFFDLTPFDHIEFDFAAQVRSPNMGLNPWNYNGGQWLYRDLENVEQLLWFEGNPPEFMEVGFRGRAKDSAMQSQFDLLSTVIHEIGHELGVNETGGPWEADPAWLPGGTATFVETDAPGHLAARTSLMCAACGMQGTRRLPSAVDIMAAADDEGFSVIDLPRLDYIGDGVWHTLLHWTGAFPPEADDDAFLRDSNFVDLTGDAAVMSLTISNDSLLRILSGNTLTVADQNTIYEELGGEGTLTISDGGSLRVNSNATAMVDALTITGGHLVTLPGAIVDVGNDLTIANDGAGFDISANGGTIAIGGKLVNDGEIIGVGDTTTFDAVGLAVNAFDLDGVGENGEVKALLGDLVFDGKLTDAFNSEMQIDAGHAITMNDDWTLGGSGTLRLTGAPGDAAVVKGNSRMTVKGSINADVGLVNADNTQFDETAIVNVGNSADRLTLATDALMLGGTYTGAGAIEQQGNITVDADVTIEVNEYDWGNSAAGNDNITTLVEGSIFTIDSTTTGTPRNEYRGTIHNAGATLNVNLASGWLLPRREAANAPAGTLNLNGGDVDDPKVNGVPLTVEGNVRANGGVAIINADFITTQWANIQAQIGAVLLLRGQNTYDGGAIFGDGEIVQWGDTDVVSDTTINTMYYDLDGYELDPSWTVIHPGVTFTINSQRIDQPGEMFNGLASNNGGTLAINTPAAWTLVGRLQLTNDNGPAFVTGAPIIVEGRIVTIGGNEIFSPVTFLDNGRVTADLPTDVLRLRDHTNYEGGEYTGAGGIIQDATAFVNAPTQIDLGFFDMDGTTESNFIELHADLTLNVDTIDISDNEFNCHLEVTDPATFTVNTPAPWTMAGVLNVVGPSGTRVTVDGADVVLASDVLIGQSNELEFATDVSGPGNFTGGGDVVFLSEYSPGASAAMVTADGTAAFGNTATFFVEIGGVVPGQTYDVLSVTGEAMLDGTLELDLSDDFVPLPGNIFEIISANGGVQSSFASVLSPTFGDGFKFDVLYNEQSVVLQVIEAPNLPGDYNYNGTVENADLTLLLNNWGATVPPTPAGWLGTPLTAPAVDNEELTALLNNWGATIGAGSASTAAVPEPATLILMILTAVGCRGLVARTDQLQLPVPGVMRVPGLFR